MIVCIKKMPLLTGTFLFSLLSFSMEPIDGYYSNDLLGAVDEAKERPHHYDYSNTYRYKRTTAQSIHLNPINLDDLEETHLSMTNKNKEDQQDKAFQSEQLTLEIDNEIFKSMKNTDQSIALPTSILPQNTARSVSLMGELSSSGILNNTTLQSTPRP